MNKQYCILQFLLVILTPLVTSSISANESDYREFFSISDIAQNVMDAGTDPVVCDNFQMTTKEVLYYFKHAREVISRAYAHDLDYSPCHVTGKLMLKSGVTGTWDINLSGIGSIDFDDGRYMYFNCLRCIPKRWRVSE